MKRILQIVATVLLLGSLTIGAAPNKTWDWDAPLTYENGTSIITGDLTDYTLHCGTSSGGPYFESQIFSTQSPPSIEDMTFVVQGAPGQYFCVSTVSSLAHGTESGFSNEANFTVLPGDLGLVPNPPANLTFQ